MFISADPNADLDGNQLDLDGNQLEPSKLSDYTVLQISTSFLVSSLSADHKSRFKNSALRPVFEKKGIETPKNKIQTFIQNKK